MHTVIHISIYIQVSVHFGFQELTSTNLSSRLESGEGWKGGEGGAGGAAAAMGCERRRPSGALIYKYYAFRMCALAPGTRGW